MFTLRNIDPKTLAALLVCAARSYRAPSIAAEAPPAAATGAGESRPPCRTDHCASGQDEAASRPVLH